jgi:hypothetical protein
LFVAYAVSYAVTYIATGSAKAAQGAGLSAALFMGIGGLRGAMRPIAIFVTMVLVIAAARKAKKKFPSGWVYSSGLFIV